MGKVKSYQKSLNCRKYGDGGEQEKFGNTLQTSYLT